MPHFTRLTRCMAGIFISLACAHGALAQASSPPAQQTGFDVAAELDATSKQADPVPTGVKVTSFQLNSATSGTLPFTVGLGFRKGDIPNVPVLDITASQVIVKARWNDGSVKHAIASGQANLVAGVPLTVGVHAAAPANAGANLGASDILAANPAASVQLGSIGTVTLSSLLGTPFRTWLSGPEMVEAHYRSQVGADPALVAWFHVRYYKGGKTFVRTIVENGYLDVTTPNRSYLPTVTIGGVMVYNNAGAMLNHYAHTRWTQEAWIGGDPVVTPKHDTAYLMSTKLVPNYMVNTPSAAALNGLYQTYAPYQSGNWSPAMGNTGYQDQIGLLPRWDALYLSSGADARAFSSVTANARALGSYPIVWNDSLTKLPVLPSNRPDWSVYGAGQGGATQIGAGALSWDIAHHGSGGFLAYLVTGDYLYLQTMQDQSATCYLIAGSGYGRGLGTSRDFLGQTRGEAWCERTVGQLAGIGPSGDAVVEDYRTLLANIGARWLGVAGTSGVNPLGYLYGYEVGGGAYNPNAGVMAPWQQHFWIQTLGHVSDLEPFSNMTTWNGFRDHMYRGIVGILGGSGASSYCYANASNYTVQIGDAANGDPTSWYGSWGTVFEKTFATANTTCGNTLLGSSGGHPSSAATGYWGNLLPAIAYAVDHGAAGAAASYARITAATNWPVLLASGFNDIPNWGIIPRALGPVDGTPPSAPANLNATPNSSSAISLSWTAATDNVGVSGYRLYRNGALVTTVATTSHTDSGLSPLTTYTYRVAATDAANNESAQSPPAQATTQSVSASGPVPAWVANLPLWQWYAIPNTALSSVAPVPTPLGITGPSSKITAWTGATLKRAGSVYMLGAAGGHGDYAGNEVNALALNTNSPKWVQLRAPSANADIINGPAQFFLDLRPAATHTYYATQFIEARNRMFVMASPGLNGPFPAMPAGWPYTGNTRSFSFNLATNDWDSPDYVAPYTGGGDFTAGMTVKHPVTDDVYMARQGSSWWRWTQATNTWVKLGGQYSYETNYAGAAIDPKRNRMLIVGDYSGTVAPRVRDLAGNQIAVTFGGLGPQVLKKTGYPGVVYDEGTDKFLVFYNNGSAIGMYRVDAATWVVDQPSTGGFAPAARPQGIQNSVQYVPELGGIVIANSYTGNVQFMRTSVVKAKPGGRLIDLLMLLLD